MSTFTGVERLRQSDSIGSIRDLDEIVEMLTRSYRDYVRGYVMRKIRKT